MQWQQRKKQESPRFWFPQYPAVFPETFIKHGMFSLHSGQKTNIFYDVNAMLVNRKWLDRIRSAVPPDCRTYVGIATGGAIIVCDWKCAMVKDGEVKGRVVIGKSRGLSGYCLVDDVVTTEASLLEAIRLIGIVPKNIFVVVDRRKRETLEIESMYKISG